MTSRRLAPEEAALWARVIASVKPLAPARPAPVRAVAVEPIANLPEPKAPATRKQGRVPPLRPVAKPAEPATGKSANTLDATWDRRLSRGLVGPESMIDLHGHGLDSAYRLLDHGLDRAIARGDRVLLLITGKPPRPESQRPHARGAIRAAIGDWLAASRHADRIAAVRAAHPSHGGAGALYIVLRRSREQPPRKS